MSVLLTNDGAQFFGEVGLGLRAYGTLSVQLVYGTWTPDVTDTFSTFTGLTGTRTGGFQLIDNNSWTGTASLGAYNGQAAPILFTLSGGSSADKIYGYYVYDNLSKVIWEELYGAPVALPAGPTHWIVVPTMIDHMC